MQHYNKVVLAYSGGLDTSVIIPWLKENCGCEVVAVAADVGQGAELDSLHERAAASGASKLYIEDLRDEFVSDYIFPTLKAGALYENKYLLGTSFARPLIAKRITEIAKAEGADAIAHGCTGKGNDQVRFELAIRAFAPEMPIIAPWRLWDIKSRDEEIDYAEAHNIPLTVSRENNYSKDKNLWHLSHEGMELEDPANPPAYGDTLGREMCVTPQQAPDCPEEVSVEFLAGVPVAVNGQKMGGVELIETLNTIGGRNAIGILDMVENRLVGMKSRGVYETPAGTILYAAHEMLEQLCLDKQTLHCKQRMAHDFADLVYNGQWYTPLREALSAFVDKTQENVCGLVSFKLYKGNLIPNGMSSKNSLYSEQFATFGEDKVYNQSDSQGFITLFGLPIKIRAMLQQTV